MTTVFTNQTKSSSETVLNNKAKTSTTFNTTSKNSSAYEALVKTSTLFNDGVYFLLTEALSFLLLETGKKIVLNQSTNYVNKSDFSDLSKKTTSFSNSTKKNSSFNNISKNASSFSNQSASSSDFTNQTKHVD